MVPSRLARLAVLATAAATLAVAGPASAGKDSPRPCTVSFTANNVHPGGTLVTGFSSACSAPEITSIDLSTSIADLRDSSAKRGCSETVAGTSASQACSLGDVKRAHIYTVTFRLTAHGNFLACADDGNCDPNDNVTSPACATDPRNTQRMASSNSDLVVTCTYRRVVAVTT